MYQSPFLDSIDRYMSVRRYSKRTIDTYLYWIKSYIIYQHKCHPETMGDVEVEQFLTFLAVERKVAAATQSVALNSLVFLYNKFLDRPLTCAGNFRRSKKRRRLAVVMNRREIGKLLDCVPDSARLLVSLLYGSGLRRIESVRLRVKDVDFNYHQLRIWQGKGFTNRLTTLAPELNSGLRSQIKKVEYYLHRDLQNSNYAGVWMPDALARKYPAARKSLDWQYLFPSVKLSFDPETSGLRRHHIDESSVNKVIKRAASLAGIQKQVSSHTPAGIGRRYPNRSGAARASGCQDHGNLHSRVKTRCSRSA